MDVNSLHELRVVDLKKELEIRGLSKAGSKKELVDRLRDVSLWVHMCVHCASCVQTV